jgi:hypothetical protein
VSPIGSKHRRNKNYERAPIDGPEPTPDKWFLTVNLGRIINHSGKLVGSGS